MVVSGWFCVLAPHIVLFVLGTFPQDADILINYLYQTCNGKQSFDISLTSKNRIRVIDSLLKKGFANKNEAFLQTHYDYEQDYPS